LGYEKGERLRERHENPAVGLRALRQGVLRRRMRELTVPQRTADNHNTRPTEANWEIAGI